LREDKKEEREGLREDKKEEREERKGFINERGLQLTVNFSYSMLFWLEE
jgi:hypothetical protein